MRKTDEKSLVKQEAYPVGSLFNFGRFRDLVEEMHSYMDTFWSNWSLDTRVFEALQPKATFPKVNVSETEKYYTVEIAVAGFDKDDVSLELKDNCLFIKSDKKEEISEEREDKKYLIKEVAFRSFRRVVHFPVEVNSDEVSCTYKDGVVKCIIGKKALSEEDKSLKIEIK